MININLDTIKKQIDQEVERSFRVMNGEDRYSGISHYHEGFINGMDQVLEWLYEQTEARSSSNIHDVPSKTDDVPSKYHDVPSNY